MKPRTMYQELELLNKKKIAQQVDLYSINSPLYNKNELRKAMLTLRASKNLPLLMAKYSAKWALEKTPVK